MTSRPEQTRVKPRPAPTASARRRIAAIAALTALALVIGGGVWLYKAISHVPTFYTEALAQDEPQLEQGNREMLRRTAALSNDLKRSGQWKALFTDRQINGWLAIDVPKNHPNLLPPQIQHPRVRITPDGVLVGARYEGDVSAVVSLDFDVRLKSTNVLAVQIRKIRVGDVPWRLDRIVDEAVAAARDHGFHVEQTQADGQPVLLVTLPPRIQDTNLDVQLEKLELRDGEVYLSGRTLPGR
jgi:hypothetical protein